MNNNSPLEHLAATVISFCLGAAATASLALYTRWLNNRATKSDATGMKT